MNRDDKVNILLVDDRPENLLALEAIIERNEYNLIKASSGQEALKHLLNMDFATILLDVQMPGIDGFGTAKIIKSREKSKNIPIIFITANNMDSNHIFVGYSLGAVDYILKPFDPTILKAKVDSFVELYRMNQKLMEQAEHLIEKTKELEKAYQDLTAVSYELRESEALANVISETSIDSMIIMDKNGSVLKINPSVSRMFMYEDQDMIGNSVSVLFTCERSQKIIKHAIEGIGSVEDWYGEGAPVEVTATRKDGTVFPAEIQIAKKYVKDKCIVACIIRDVTKQKQHEELISHMAYHDSLTDLPNKRMFNDHLSTQIQEAKRNNQTLTLLYLDMDRFKYINDSLGHHMGDRLLRNIANRLTACVGEGGFVARIGGDEFNIVLPQTNRERAIELAEHLLAALKQPFLIDNYELFITVSVGISIFPYDGEDSLTLIKNADAALYRAKEQGKNTFRIYHSGLNIQSYRNFFLQNDLRKAIERQELSLVYQPQLDVQTGMINGAEALLRWNHPEWGIIMPSEFIPLAEETGQMMDIGDWVLRTACEQYRSWVTNGVTPVRISVNVSPVQFLQKNVLDKFQQIVLDTGMNPNMLALEITESVMIQDEMNLTKTLHSLKKLGIRIAMDDFGTGYSSLNGVRRFPIDIIKIDRSFIRDLTHPSADSSALVSSILALANSLNMSVTAEGVETEQQFNLLKKLNCGQIQGYYISAPVPPEELEALLLKNMPDRISFKKTAESPQPSNPDSYMDQNQQILHAALSRTKEQYSISVREYEVFEQVVNGLSNREISDKLFISEHTVKNHITRIFQKLRVNDRLQAMALVYQACIEEGKSLRVQ